MLSIMDPIVELRVKYRLTLREIAARMNVSKTYVGNYLNKSGFRGNRVFLELLDPETFDRPDDVIAKQLGVRESRVAAARRKLGLRKQRYVNFSARRDAFTLEVFGRYPGPDFDLITEFIREKLNDLMATKTIAFYVEMRNDQQLYSRVSRVSAKNILKQCATEEVIEDMIRKGILV